MGSLTRLLRAEPAKKSEHVLLNWDNFIFFSRSERSKVVLFFGNSGLLAVPVAVPYALGCEPTFFRQQRFFIRVKQQVVGILVVHAKPDALYIGSLAVTPEYRRLGVASYIIGFCDQLAPHLGKGPL